MKKRFWLAGVVFLLVLAGFCLGEGICETDADCEIWGGNVCLEGECYLSEVVNCTTELDCLEGQVCVEGVCQAGEEAAQNLTEETVNINERFPDYMPLNQKVNNLVDEVGAVTQENQRIDSELNRISAQVQTLDQNVKTVDSKIEGVKSDVESVKAEVNQQVSTVNTVSTGLAAMQAKVEEAGAEVDVLGEKLGLIEEVEESRSAKKKIWWGVIFLLVLGGVGFYVLRYKVKRVPFELKKHIHQSLKKGKVYSLIRKELVKAEWPEELVDKAYKKVLARNYQKHAESRKGVEKGKGGLLGKLWGRLKVGRDKEKMLIIGVVSVVVILGLFFMLQKTGVVAGKAIAVGTMGLEEFKPLVKGTLSERFTKNRFYPSLPSVDVCVQVLKSSVESVSYRITKTFSVYAIRETSVPCDNSYGSYDFVIKFTSWEAFNQLVSGELTCEKFGEIHQAKGFYVLPSKYVMPGFKVDPSKDYTPFCRVLSQCFSTVEIRVLGISC